MGCLSSAGNLQGIIDGRFLQMDCRQVDQSATFRILFHFLFSFSFPVDLVVNLPPYKPSLLSASQLLKCWQPFYPKVLDCSIIPQSGNNIQHPWAWISKEIRAWFGPLEACGALFSACWFVGSSSCSADAPSTCDFYPKIFASLHGNSTSQLLWWWTDWSHCCP